MLEMGLGFLDHQGSRIGLRQQVVGDIQMRRGVTRFTHRRYQGQRAVRLLFPAFGRAGHAPA